jgi:SRSO17 transposase
MRLYLPPAWLNDPTRLDRAGVPPEERRDLTKGQIALELLDQARAEGWPGQGVVADAAYGVWRPVSPGVGGARFVLCGGGERVDDRL